MGVSHLGSESSSPVLTSLADAAQNRDEQTLLSPKLQICEQSNGLLLFKATTFWNGLLLSIR